MPIEEPGYDHILIPTDGSIETEQAVSHGLGLARTYDATVHALYVTDESEFSAVTDASAHEQLRSSAEKLGRRATADVAEMSGTTVHALYVVDTNTYAYEDVPRSIVGLLKESGNTALDEIAEMARERGVEVETPVRRGRPSRDSSTTSTRTTWTSSRWAHMVARARSISGVPPSA